MRAPVTQTIEATAARGQLDELLTQVARNATRILVEENGTPVAAIVPVADLEWLKEREAQRAALFEALETTGAAFKDVPEEELEREIAKAIAEVRAENRAREQVAGRTA